MSYYYNWWLSFNQLLTTDIIACNKYIRNIKSFPLEEMYYSCYMYPEQGSVLIYCSLLLSIVYWLAKPLLSKEKNGKEFGLSTNSDNSTGTIDNVLCDLGEESGWTPSVPQSILDITFKTNHLLTAIEVRGELDNDKDFLSFIFFVCRCKRWVDSTSI